MNETPCVKQVRSPALWFRGDLVQLMAETCRGLYWPAIAKRHPTCLTVCDPINCSLPGSSVHGDSPGKNTKVGCRALLQGVFPTQGLNPGILHCRRILDYLGHQRSPRVLKWVAYPFSRGSAWPGIELGCPELQEDSLPTKLWGKPTDTGGQPEIQQKLRIFGLLPNSWFCFCIFLHFASIYRQKYSV